MRLAISVIGWQAEDDDTALVSLAEAGARGFEVAPTRVFGSWEAATPAAVGAYRERCAEHDLEIPALQSLMFGIDGASLTEDVESRRIAAEHLERVAEIAGGLGAGAAVFGSPANRRRGDLDWGEAARRASEVLRRAGEAFAANESQLVLEHNPPEYGCDFLTTWDEMADFVAEVDHPGVAPHLDLGGLRLTGEDYPSLHSRLPGHLHLSAPNLAPFDAEPADWHRALLGRLRAAGYDGWASIEQRPAGEGLEAPLSAIAAARGVLDG
ncbi:MAG: sugar phosphate isomerase/epimerase [Thermoleophilaceae bacterium]|nr:sugar phosphate isomerase/epimerase [Thermoleophilaceae bacterium]